ncbi:ion channel [Congregibacter brevis]|uniref:Ion channel n=1 Tax=Congregibacter brevis TaxID=3081201 RepID=A0ABZ0IHM8_9GAMM|nr:ion channel [Congregibacter sp. IMCC45268]
MSLFALLQQILIGSLMIVATVVIEACFIAIAVATLEKHGPRLRQLSLVRGTILMLSGLSLWLLAAISLALWLWAGMFVVLGEFTDLGQAIYFASVSATTLGYGDVVLSERWQLLSGFIAANGLVLFSLNTAFLFEALRRISDR